MPTLIGIISEGLNTVISLIAGFGSPNVSIFGQAFNVLAAIFNLLTLGIFAAG